jgi:hypothetical protein
MAHPLDGVKLKLMRAKRHLDEVIRVTKGFEIGKCRVLPETSKDGTLVVLVVHLPPVPAELSVMVGDCLFNLRSSLDHIIWQLCEGRSQKPGNRTSFPIMTTQEAFERAKATRLGGVPAEAQRIVEAFQPYRDEDSPLGLLDRLHNIDKHRKLNLTTAVSTDTSLTWMRDGHLVYQCIIGCEELRHGRNLGVGVRADSEVGKKLLADGVVVSGEAVMFVAFVDAGGQESLESDRVDTNLENMFLFITERIVPRFEVFFR